MNFNLERPSSFDIADAVDDVRQMLATVSGGVSAAEQEQEHEQEVAEAEEVGEPTEVDVPSEPALATT